MNNIFKPHNLRTLQFKEWLESPLIDCENGDALNLLIAVSGYESRSSNIFKQIIRKKSLKTKFEYLIFGFTENKEILHRPLNDEIYIRNAVKIQEIGIDRQQELCHAIQNYIDKLKTGSRIKQISVHVDYSSMPRSWYCNLPIKLTDYLGPLDQVYFWYTPGDYQVSEYPSAGIDDFKVFKGTPTPNAKFRTHILGLGFDRIRSQAIWSVLDPQNLICFYADPAVKKSYIRKVIQDNKDVIMSANHILTLPIRDFAYSYSRIRSLVYDFRNNGDVIIVPDGPKPFILASSIIPCTIDDSGITCIHVTRRRSPEVELVDVRSYGEPFGFSYSVNKMTSLQDQKPDE